MSNSYNNSDTQLITFLRQLADSIESEQIHQEQLKRIGEFYMSYIFQEELVNNNKDNSNKEFEDMDVIKFITLGWWIYNHLNDEGDNDEGDNDEGDGNVIDVD